MGDNKKWGIFCMGKLLEIVNYAYDWNIDMVDFSKKDG